MNLGQALAGASAPARRSGGPGRVALVAGVVGRRGEALLNRVLASGDYAEVVALSSVPMALGVRGLRLAGLADLPEVDDLFLLISDPDDASSRSFYGRDAAFVAVDEQNCLQVARRAVEQGARRAVLIDPMPAWQQVGNFHRGLANPGELAVASLPLDSLVVLRPVRDGKRRGANLVERFVAAYLSVQLLMLPKSIGILTSETLARCALQAMRGARDGLQVHPADTLTKLLEQTA